MITFSPRPPEHTKIYIHRDNRGVVGWLQWDESEESYLAFLSNTYVTLEEIENISEQIKKASQAVKEGKF